MVGHFVQEGISMSRFFVSPNQIQGSTIYIEGEDVSHISRVLRMRLGDTLTVCDGASNDYICTIKEMDKTRVVASILESAKNTCEPDCAITVYQGIPKGAKMDYIVQKCVEVGVCRIVPVETMRVVAKGEVKTERLSRIALEAAKQSGRGIVPTVCNAISFSEAVEEAKLADLAIIPYECEREVSLKQILSGQIPKCVSVMIGPEGGFAPEEILCALKNNIHAVSLGRRILRTETAALVTAGNILYETEG